MQEPCADRVSRDFTVAVFVVNQDRVLLQYHQKLNRWLPPGGHIELNELPDQAALREVLEETGVVASLWGTPRIGVAVPGQPQQLCPPMGVQLAMISPGHEHIDLIYFATSLQQLPQHGADWFGPDEWSTLDLTDEVLAWCELAVRAIGSRP